MDQPQAAILLLILITLLTKKESITLIIHIIIILKIQKAVILLANIIRHHYQIMHIKDFLKRTTKNKSSNKRSYDEKANFDKMLKSSSKILIYF
jgi:hypothetical protein